MWSRNGPGFSDRGSAGCGASAALVTGWAETCPLVCAAPRGGDEGGVFSARPPGPPGRCQAVLVSPTAPPLYPGARTQEKGRYSAALRVALCVCLTERKHIREAAIRQMRHLVRTWLGEIRGSPSPGPRQGKRLARPRLRGCPVWRRPGPAFPDRFQRGESLRPPIGPLPLRGVRRVTAAGGNRKLVSRSLPKKGGALGVLTAGFPAFGLRSSTREKLATRLAKRVEQDLRFRVKVW